MQAVIITVIIVSFFLARTTPRQAIKMDATPQRRLTCPEPTGDLFFALVNFLG